MYLIEKYFHRKFHGKTFGEAWEFIGQFIGQSYEDFKGVKRVFGKNKSYSSLDDFMNEVIGLERSINFQDEYFNNRHEAMLRGEDWGFDDRISYEVPDNIYND